MKLETYLSINKVTQTEFAKTLGVTQGLVHQWISGKTKVTAERAKEIEVATNKTVCRHHLLPEVFDEPISSSF